jgi:beta-mannosidase
VPPLSRPPIALDLGGADWEVRDALGDTWEWYIRSAITAGNSVGAAVGAAQRAPGWLPATVPGSAITDLVAAGELPDPRVGRNSRFAEWTADRSWVYRRAVEVPELEPGATAVLELDGVDPAARVFWDGAALGEVTGLFRSARFRVPLPVRRAGRPTVHTLVVVVAPVPASEPQVGRTERVRIHAPRMNYGWDFCPPFPDQGIWQGIRLRVGRELLGDVSVRTELAGGEGRVVVTAGWEVTTELLLDGIVVATGGSELRVDAPELWWPAGLGPQRLYEVRVRTEDDLRVLSVGFRTAEFEQNPGSPAAALPYTAVVNGVRVPLVGWNWVPVDAQYAAGTGARLRHLVSLAAASGARLLRVWGGGLIETEEFYRLCDEAGLLVWQEFSQSSSGAQSAPAADDAFVAYLRSEAEAIVPTRTHHPSLLLWGGGNELDEGGVPLTEERSPALAALRNVVARLDPGRHWVATSPTGPAFHNRLDVIAAAPDDQHDVHGPWEHQGLVDHYRLYNAGNSLAHTEFGVEGMTNRRALDRLVPFAEQDPPDRTNAVYRHLGDWWNNADLVRSVFGGRIRDVDGMRRASQWLQATGLAYAVEADRRRFPRCSMVLPWQLGESFPNAWCTAVVDYLGEPKPAFDAVARAFARDRVTLRTDAAAWSGGTASAEAWIWSEEGRGPGTVTLRARGLTGVVLAEESWAVDGAEDPRSVGRLELAAPEGLFLWEAEWDGIDVERMVATGDADLGALLDLPPAIIEVVRSGDVLTVSHREGPAAIGLRLSDARPGDAAGALLQSTGDPRPLLPGERRSFLVGGAGAGELLLEAWNVEPLPVPAG